MAIPVAQRLARALVYCYPVTKHYWTLFTLIAFSYFLGTKLYNNGADSLSIVNSLLWANTLIIWTGFILEGLIRYFGLWIEIKIKSNPNSYWVNFKSCMPYLLTYICGVSFAITSGVVFLGDGKAVVPPIEAELVAALVWAVFYMVMAFGKDFGYSPSVSLSAAFLGLIGLRTGFAAVVCIVLFVSTLILYPQLSKDFGLRLRNFAETGRWVLPAEEEKKVGNKDIGVEEMPGLIGLLVSPVKSSYQLFVLERVHVGLIVLVSLAALVVVLESRVSPSLAGEAYEVVGTFLEMVNLKHVNYKEMPKCCGSVKLAAN